VNRGHPFDPRAPASGIGVTATRPVPAPHRPGSAGVADFLARYERRLDHMSAGRDDRALELTSPRLRAHPNRHRMAPRI
ncbi:hypothetical protein ACE14D_12295, partial [Streptomyces sp. Act-28]